MKPLSLPPPMLSAKTESTSCRENQQETPKYEHEKATKMDPYNYSLLLFKLQYEELLLEQQQQKQLQQYHAEFNTMKCKLAPKYQARLRLNSPSENYVGSPRYTTTKTRKYTISHVHVYNGHRCDKS
eukprot:443110_1